MINLELFSDNINYRKMPYNVFVVETIDENTIKTCIDMFNSQIIWDKQFTIEIAKDRLASGEQFFVGYFDNIIFGYCWLKTHDKNKKRIYNVFSFSTKFKRNYGATDMLYDVIVKNVNGIVDAEVDDWNVKSLNIFYKLGFTIVES